MPPPASRQGSEVRPRGLHRKSGLQLHVDRCRYMPMKRTNIHADPEGLAIIKEAAARRGISEAEIIRQGIHLSATADRVWDEPLFSRTFEGPGRTPSKEEVRNTVADSVSNDGGPGSIS